MLMMTRRSRKAIRRGYPDHRGLRLLARDIVRRTGVMGRAIEEHSGS